MVTTRLVDGRSAPSWNGWSLYLIEVHHNRVAPVPGLDRLWRRLERVDTIPHIRSLGTVAVVGDTVVIGVGGNSVTAFSYDVRTKELSRTPQPDWLNTALVTPPPAFSPDGRFIAYISQYGNSRLTVRSWPDGRIAWQTAPVQPRQLGRPDGGAITWANPELLWARFPVFDSGPSWAVFKGRVRNGEMKEEKWLIYLDPQSDEFRRRIATPPPAAPMKLDSAAEPREDPWARAAGEIRRLPPAAFPELPKPFLTELEQLGCTVPQSGYTGSRGNVIHGSFGAAGQQDWAALCSRNGTSVVLVYWGGRAQCPREILPAEDKHFLQGLGGGRIGFSRGIGRTNSYHVYPDETDTTSVDENVTLEHDAIEDAFEGKASTVWFCRDGKWIAFSGAD